MNHLRWGVPLLAATLLAAQPASAQAPPPATVITPENLRTHLFIIADDSMGGRDPGSKGNYLTADYVAAVFKRAGLVPAGDKGTWFQTVPFVRLRLDERGTMTVLKTAGNTALHAGADFIPVSWIPSRPSISPQPKPSTVATHETAPVGSLPSRPGARSWS